MGSIGIDAIGIAVPEGFLDMSKLAAARGVASTKYSVGLGVSRMSVANVYEDPVTLAANAATRMLLRAEVHPSEVGMCVVGTESGVDHSKPIAAYLHELLHLPNQCRTFETKHACFGGTAGLFSAVEWIASGAGRGRKALVICTDIARYVLNSPGEPTQGAGAVAMLVSESPRIMEIVPGLSGAYSKNVHDFWRPLYSKDAVVDGALSVQCYLDALSGAYTAFKQRVVAMGVDVNPVRRCYHVPYGKMAMKAHRHLMLLDGRSEAEFEESYQREVAPSLRIPSQVGNTYTASLYMALASLLDSDASGLEGQDVGLFSYGSGCCAEYFVGRVVTGAGAFMQQLSVSDAISCRKEYSVYEYEAIRGNDYEADKREADTATTSDGVICFKGVCGDRRVYSHNTSSSGLLAIEIDP